MSDQPCYFCQVRPSDIGDRDTRIDELERQLEAAREALRGLEWGALRRVSGTMTEVCAQCGNSRTTGHHPQCALMAALAPAPPEPPALDPARHHCGCVIGTGHGKGCMDSIAPLVDPAKEGE